MERGWIPWLIIHSQNSYDTHWKMDFFDSTYYNLTKTLMTLVGIWPYQEVRTRIPRMIISYGFLCLLVLSLFAKIFTTEPNVNNIVNILSILMPCLCYLIGYITFHCKLEQTKTFFELMKSNWTVLQNPEEINIFKKYATKSRNIAIVMTVIFYGVILLALIDFTLPLMLDVVVPLNETRERKFLIPLETFVRLEYTAAGLIFITIACTVAGFVALSAYSCFLIGIYHTCAMFRVTGYILEHTFDESDQYACTKKEYEIIHKKILRTIGFHIRTIKFFESLLDLSEVCYSLQMSLAMLTIAAHYVKIMLINKEKFMEDTSDAISFSIEFGGVIFSVFINCHAGQEIINHSNEIFDKAAVAPWYLLPKSVQSSAIIILMRSQIPCFLGVGKTYVSSYEFFVSLVKTSVSYATVCYTMK